MEGGDGEDGHFHLERVRRTMLHHNNVRLGTSFFRAERHILIFGELLDRLQIRMWQ
jgi:hypothetical protein